MGKSITINVIGFSADEGGKRYVCHATTKTEMVQEAKKMADCGHPVIGWYAQTNQGRKMLRYDNRLPGCWEEVPDGLIKHVTLRSCPICDGDGVLDITEGVKHGCPICNSSGLCRTGHEKQWRSWQIEGMKETRRKFLAKVGLKAA